MFDKVAAIFGLFRVGQSVANPAAWKTGAITVSLLLPVFMQLRTVMQAFGIDLGLSDETVTALAGGFVAGINVLVTLVSSKTVGVLPAKG